MAAGKWTGLLQRKRPICHTERLCTASYEFCMGREGVPKEEL